MTAAPQELLREILSLLHSAERDLAALQHALAGTLPTPEKEQLMANRAEDIQRCLNHLRVLIGERLP